MVMLNKCKCMQINELTKYVAYYRVSTAKQGASGLGLDAQKTAVAQKIGNNGEIIAAYTEIESGKKVNRVELDKALAHAKKIGATLIVAKLDRLARNVEFIFSLKNSGVQFQACDMSDFNTLTVGIFSTIAEHEREMISSRTKAALQAKKERGVKLGAKGTENLIKSDATEKAKTARIVKAETAKENIQAKELIKMYFDNGLTLRNIAKKLNELGYKTTRGNDFSHSQVRHLLKKVKGLK